MTKVWRPETERGHKWMPRKEHLFRSAVSASRAALERIRERKLSIHQRMVREALSSVVLGVCKLLQWLLRKLEGASAFHLLRHPLTAS